MLRVLVASLPMLCLLGQEPAVEIPPLIEAGNASYLKDDYKGTLQSLLKA